MMRVLPNRFVLLPIAFGIAAIGSATAWAESAGIEEIVVTARKVEESQQSLPISIAAFSAKDIEQNVVLSVADLQRVVPGLVVASVSQGGQPSFAIRGTKTDNGVDGGVSVYLDDMPLLTAFSVANSYYDIASVEILKGPQGTQFGTNTTGGTITVRAAKPTDKFEGYAEVGVGNYNRSSFQGMVNIPVNDVLQVRLAGEVVDRDGFIKNTAANRGPIPKAFNDDKHDSFRLSVRLKPTSTLTNDIVADYYHEDDAARQSIPVAFDTTPLGAVSYNLGLFGGQLGTWKSVNIGVNPATVALGINTDRPLYNKHKNWGIQDVLNWEINDNVSIKNVLGYRDDDNNTNEDNDGTSVDAVNSGFISKNKMWVDDFTVRLNTDDKRLRGTAGFFYSSAERIQGGVSNLIQNIFMSPPAFNPLTPFGVAPSPIVSITHFWEKRDLQSHAIYANADYDLTKELTVSAGLRYNWDSGTFKYSWANGTSLPDLSLNTDLFPTPAQPPSATYPLGRAAVPCAASTITAQSDSNVATCLAKNTAKWKAPSYNFVITDKFAERSLIYFKASGAYLAGGFNAGVRETIGQTFKPEKTYTFETGLKSDWDLWSRPIRTNFDVFYGNSKNKQIVENGTYADGASFIGVFNAGALTFYGTDLEVKYFPVDGLELDATWTHLDASFDQFNFPNIANLPATDLSGRTPAQVPRDTVNLGMTITWPLSSDNGKLSTTFNSYYASEVAFLDIPNLVNAFGVQAFPESANKSKDYWVSSFSTDWKNIMGSSFDATFWVKNLFDKKYIVNTGAQAFLGYATATYGEPRTLGLNVRYNF